MTIEDIILDRDRRGISELRPFLPSDFCDQAANLLISNPGTVLITTGFYILASKAPETDGPPGAIIIEKALTDLGYKVVHVSDQYTTNLLEETSNPGSQVIEFPITDSKSSEDFARDLLQEFDPSVLISIERCGLTDDGYFRNMRGLDMTEFNAKTDYLFTQHSKTIGIGDGGNEIGMGNLSTEVANIASLVDAPCTTTVKNLVISSVSNWGGYGLVASLSKLKGLNLLPTIEEEQLLLTRMVNLGAVDGTTSKNENTVDGFTMEEHSLALADLHGYLDSIGVPRAT